MIAKPWRKVEQGLINQENSPIRKRGTALSTGMDLQERKNEKKEHQKNRYSLHGSKGVSQDIGNIYLQ